MNNADQAFTDAVTAMASLSHWPVFIGAMKDKRRQWLADAKNPLVYRDHAELVQVTARAGELDDWITLLEHTAKAARGPSAM